MNRDAYVEKTKAMIDQWNAEIDKLEAKTRAAQADAKIEYEKQLATLREQRDAAEVQMDKARKASEAAWADMQAGFLKAWEDISDAANRAMNRYRN